MRPPVGELTPPRTFTRRGRRAVLVLAAAFLVLALLRLLTGVHPGLNAEYFPGEAPGTLPAVTALDSRPSTQTIEARWPSIIPEVFRVRWFGFLAVDERGSYTFTITADDSALLTIDGATVVDTGGRRGTFVVSGTAQLSPGPHPIVIEYRQAGGDYAFDWTWSHDGSAPEPVPGWRLMPRRSVWTAQRMGRGIDVALVMAAFLLLAWLAGRHRHRLVPLVREHQMVAVLALFFAMAIVQTWPLARDPVHLSRNDNSDTVLNEWALAWVAHQAVRDPLHLFDANIFYPERFTLAFSESMIVQAATAAPLFWAGLSPVLVYNLMVMAGFTLNGWVMTWVMRRWTGDLVAAVTGGMLFAFNSNILTRLPHMQALHVEFLPLALYAWDRLLRQPRVRHAAAFGSAVALQSLTSVYLLVFTFSAVCAAVLARAGEWIGARFRQIAPLVLLAAAVAAAITVPFLLPYLWTHQTQGFERSLDDARSLAATVGSYLSSPSQLHYGLWSYRWFGNPSALFPGVTATALAVLALARGVALRDRRARIGLAVLVCGVLLSFGPKLPGYALLFTYVPIYRVVRVTSSFGYLALMGLAIVAGFGMVELRRLLSPSRRVWWAAASIVLAFAFVEPLAAPIELVPYKGIPRIYDLLRDERQAVIVELPFYTASAGFQQARYMLNGTRHWRPMLNGYSGYRPESYYRNGEALAGFPSVAAIEWLRRQGVTHMFVHLDEYGPSVQPILAAIPGVREVASERTIRLYQIR
jgi:hypothetical protein